MAEDDVLAATLGSFLTSTGFLSTGGLTGDDAGLVVVVGVVGVDVFDVLAKPVTAAAAVFTGLAVIGDLFVVVVLVVELGSDSCRG